jgi:glyoxylase-like metal-dependent hydrolase (beta-lactamase superfamily II)
MDLVVDRYELGPIATNCYLLRAHGGAEECVVVDPGADAAALRLELARLQLRCEAILVTHTHWDHIGGVAELAEVTGAPVHVSDIEAPVLERPDDFYAALGVRIRPHVAEVRLDGDEALGLAGISFETLPVPGHSPGHLAFHANSSLFSGDVLFAGGVGRVDLPGGDWETLLGSIRTLTDRYPEETVVYSGHGPPTTLGDELARNPFLLELRAAQ